MSTFLSVLYRPVEAVRAAEDQGVRPRFDWAMSVAVCEWCIIASRRRLHRQDGTVKMQSQADFDEVQSIIPRRQL